MNTPDDKLRMKTAVEISILTSEGLILALWRQGLDTSAIASHMKLREHQIYNRLFHLREAAR